MTAKINTATLRIDDVFCTQSGSKIARIRDGDGDLDLIPGVSMRSPFAAGTFDKDPTATRLNLSLVVDDSEFLQNLQQFDNWMVEYLAANSERLFKREMSESQIRMGYSPVLREPTKEGLCPLLKTKLDTEGRYAVCCWDEAGAGLPPPESWAGLRLEPRLHFSHLWIMGAQFGVVIRLTDAKILREQPSGPRKCPF